MRRADHADGPGNRARDLPARLARYRHGDLGLRQRCWARGWSGHRERYRRNLRLASCFFYDRAAWGAGDGLHMVRPVAAYRADRHAPRLDRVPVAVGGDDRRPIDDRPRQKLDWFDSPEIVLDAAV